MKALTLATLALILAPHQAAADKYQAAMESYYTENLASWASNPLLVNAVKAQNAGTDYDQATIDSMDAEWRANATGTMTPMIERVVFNPAADFLRAEVFRSGGALTEAFLMDDQGLNVAASDPTSDYWQGDEAKFQQTFSVGPDAIHYGDVDIDESTGAIQGQVSVTIKDPDTGTAIGAITIGIDLGALM